nr:hypothetical membrane protein [uncultured archaeon]
MCNIFFKKQKPLQKSFLPLLLVISNYFSSQTDKNRLPFFQCTHLQDGKTKDIPLLINFFHHRIVSCLPEISCFTLKNDFNVITFAVIPYFFWNLKLCHFLFYHYHIYICCSPNKNVVTLAKPS